MSFSVCLALFPGPIYKLGWGLGMRLYRSLYKFETLKCSYQEFMGILLVHPIGLFQDSCAQELGNEATWYYFHAGCVAENRNYSTRISNFG